MEEIIIIYKRQQIILTDGISLHIMSLLLVIFILLRCAVENLVTYS